MKLSKGMKIKVTKIYKGEQLLTKEDVSVWEVVRVNPKTYTIHCVEGAYNFCCFLSKDFSTEYVDEYGTKTTREIVA